MGREGQERQARQAAHSVQARPYAQAARDRVGPPRFGDKRPWLQALAVRRGVLTLSAARAKPEQPPGSGTRRVVLAPGILALQPKCPRCRRTRRRVAGNPAQGSVSLARRDRGRARRDGFPVCLSERARSVPDLTEEFTMLRGPCPMWQKCPFYGPFHSLTEEEISISALVIAPGAHAASRRPTEHSLQKNSTIS